MRTFAQGIDHRFTGSDAESLGGNGFGQRTAPVSGGGVTAYDGRDGTQDPPVQDGPSTIQLKKTKYDIEYEK